MSETLRERLLYLVAQVDGCRAPERMRGALLEAAGLAEYAVSQHEALRAIQQRAMSEAMGEELEDAQADLRAIYELARAALAKNPSTESDTEAARDLGVGGAQLAQTGGNSGGMPLSVGRSRPDQTATSSLQGASIREDEDEARDASPTPKSGDIAGPAACREISVGLTTSPPDQSVHEICRHLRVNQCGERQECAACHSSRFLVGDAEWGDWLSPRTEFQSGTKSPCDCRVYCLDRDRNAAGTTISECQNLPRHTFSLPRRPAESTTDYLDTPHYRVNRFVSAWSVVRPAMPTITYIKGMDLSVADLEAVVRESAPLFTGERIQVGRDADDAARYRYLRDESLLDGHVSDYEVAHELDESQPHSEEYRHRCDRAIDALRTVAGKES